MRFWKTTLVISAPVFLGTAAGWLTGQTGADSTVVAAVLPAVLTGGGGALLAFKLKTDGKDWHQDFVVASAFVTVFSLFLVVGTYLGMGLEERAAEEDIVSALEAEENAREINRRQSAMDLDFRYKFLEECSRKEAIINASRKVLGLQPIPTEVICGFGRIQPVGDPLI